MFNVIDANHAIGSIFIATSFDGAAALECVSSAKLSQSDYIGVTLTEFLLFLQNPEKIFIKSPQGLESPDIFHGDGFFFLPPILFFRRL